jgi:hypothetical protein
MSLYRMMEVCSASMQRSIQGLDNTSTAEGSDAFDDLLSLLDNCLIMLGVIIMAITTRERLM